MTWRYQGLSIYLLFAIGLKGGVAVSETPISELLAPAFVTAVLGILTPLSAFVMLKYFGRLSSLDASAAAAAHYGSVSAVTFLAALVAILEVPGIIVGLMLAQILKAGGIKKSTS